MILKEISKYWVAATKNFYQRVYFGFCIFLFCLFAHSSRVLGQEQPVWVSLDSCKQMAVVHNEKAKIAQFQLKKITAERESYLANFFPKISLQGLYLLTTASTDYHTRFDMYNTTIPDIVAGWSLPSRIYPYLERIYKEIGADIDLNLTYNHTFMAGVQVQQPLFWGGKIITAYRMARTGTDMAKLNIIRTRQEVVYQTEEAYWQLVKVTRLHQSALKYKEAVESVLKDAENAETIGMLASTDKLKAEVKRGEALLLIRQAENGMKLARMNLCMVTGQNLLTPLFPSDSVPETLPADLLEATPDVSKRIEYALLQKQLSLKKANISLMMSDYLPQIALMGGYYYLDGVWLNDEKLFQNGSFSAILSLSIPITNWGEGARKIQSAKADFLMTEAENKEKIELMSLEIVQMQHVLDEAIFKVENARLAVKQAAENERMIHDRYDLGFETMSTLIEAQTWLHKATSELIESQIAMKLAESNLRRKTGY
ncbi:MAG: TolC family protein [Bacteroidales bacterium]|jgi:outer membrane protein TolC|nr:TolC family protein [Bacteroidales bacterium]